MQSFANILAIIAATHCLTACAPRREGAVHFQEGFSPSPTNDPVVELSYNGEIIFSGRPHPNGVTGHPYVVSLKLGRETNGIFQVAISGVLTQSVEVAWSRGLALGLQFTNGKVTYVQSSDFGYILE